MKTVYVNPSQQDAEWYLIDAEDSCLGRLASHVAFLLMGKHKPSYAPFWNPNVRIIVTHADKFSVTGVKLDDKIYYRHSGYPGGLKKMTLQEKTSRRPTDALRHAVRGMLPKNRLGRDLLNNLYLYARADHPHSAQMPTPLTGDITSKRGLFSALRDASAARTGGAQ